MKRNHEKVMKFIDLLLNFPDQINPVFNRFKNQVFTRNPSVNSPKLKIYWIGKSNFIIPTFFCILRFNFIFMTYRHAIRESYGFCFCFLYTTQIAYETFILVLKLILAYFLK